MTDPVGNRTLYAYNQANLLTQMTDPFGHNATYAYDQANQLTSYTDRDGRTSTFAYDQAGRLTGETWVGGSYTATFTYNKDSELKTAQDPFSSYSFTYNNDWLLTSASNAGTPGAPTVTLNYGYDGFFNQTSLGDSNGGSISYGYDLDRGACLRGGHPGSRHECHFFDCLG